MKELRNPEVWTFSDIAFCRDVKDFFHFLLFMDNNYLKSYFFDYLKGNADLAEKIIQSNYKYFFGEEDIDLNQYVLRGIL